MDRWSDVRIGDLIAALARYRPVVLTVAVILAIVAWAPGPRYSRPEPLDTTFEERPLSPASNTAPAAVPPAPGVAGGAQGGGFAAAPGTSFDSSFDSSFATSPSFDAPAASGDEAASPDATFDPVAPGDVGDDGRGARPLGIAGTGWASSTAATPIGAQGVPPNSLPVGKRFGQDDKRSYVRLAGQGTVLTLVEEPSGTRGPVGTGRVVVRACKITGEWEDGAGKTFDEVPFDASTCVEGLRDGPSWSFDLGGFSASERVDRNGFALVPGARDADVDYQVAFRIS